MVSSSATVTPTYAVNRPIPNNDGPGVTSAITVNDDITVEWVEVFFNATHGVRSQLEVSLVSPDGTTSLLAERRAPSNQQGYESWLFTSARHWGESSLGGDAWQLRLYGTAKLDGDITLDGRVDADDFNRWQEYQFQSETTWATGDLNGDHHTDAYDFNIWRENAFVTTPGVNIERTPRAPLAGVSGLPLDRLKAIRPVQHGGQAAHDEAMKEWSLKVQPATSRLNPRLVTSLSRRSVAMPIATAWQPAAIDEGNVTRKLVSCVR